MIKGIAHMADVAAFLREEPELYIVYDVNVASVAREVQAALPVREAIGLQTSEKLKTLETVQALCRKLLEAGAKDVYTIPIGMKKSRPGILVRVMCTAEDRERLLSLIFRHSSTIGVRENICGRYILDRREETVMTDLGPVRRKISSGYGVKRCKYEYEDIKRIASENDLSLNEVLARLPDVSPKEGI